MSLNEACVDIAALSTICGQEGYQSQNITYHDADKIVGKVSSVVVRSLGRSITRRPPARCRAAIRTLTCSVVFPQCPSGTGTRVPHYSELLNRVSGACSVGIDDLSDRLVVALSQQGPGGAARHWRTSLAQASDEWAQQRLVWPTQYDSGADSAVGGLAVCAVMCFSLWWFGVWLVRQWSRDMADALNQLHQPPRPLATSSKEGVAIEILD